LAASQRQTLSFDGWRPWMETATLRLAAHGREEGWVEVVNIGQ
jgi:hypothetical protein